MVVLVTPYLVDPMDCRQAPCKLPGFETRTPDDFELFLELILEAPRGQREVFPNKKYRPRGRTTRRPTSSRVAAGLVRRDVRRLSGCAKAAHARLADAPRRPGGSRQLRRRAGRRAAAAAGCPAVHANWRPTDQRATVPAVGTSPTGAVGR